MDYLVTTFSKLYAWKTLVRLKSLLANSRVKRSGLGARLAQSIRRLLETHGPPPHVMAKKKKKGWRKTRGVQLLRISKHVVLDPPCGRRCEPQSSAPSSAWRYHQHQRLGHAAVYIHRCAVWVQRQTGLQLLGSHEARQTFDDEYSISACTNDSTRQQCRMAKRSAK